jgi:aryl-alcohol dehydrogenase-like predicted oxidoreductase
MTTHSAHTQVQRARLGRTGMNVSRIAFGTWHIARDAVRVACPRPEAM